MGGLGGAYLLCGGVEVGSHLQAEQPLLGGDGELLPHAVEAWQRVSGGARGAAQGLAQHHRGLEELPAVVVRTLETNTHADVHTQTKQTHKHREKRQRLLRERERERQREREAAREIGRAHV